MANAARPLFVSSSGLVAKRKRRITEKLTDHEVRDVKRRNDITALRSPISPIENKLMTQPSELVQPPMDVDLIRYTVETQFSLEILLKHNELRLIDQELAKCQVALEQLRRCHLIPYPVSMATPESTLSVSNGTGPAVNNEEKTPLWAPAFGITDGPYTRHYAKWLIPDPIFDGPGRQSDVKSRDSEATIEGRATRYCACDSLNRPGKSGLRRATGQKLHSLSNGYPSVKDKAGPCVLTRADGQTVKLVCLDCHRDNFSSTQGFINHCRIAHRRDFKSHEEAAIASGQVIETCVPAKTVGDRASVPLNGLVHPLIRNAPSGPEAVDACKALLSRVADSKAMLREGKLPGFTSEPKLAVEPADVPLKSSPAPYLSTIWRQKKISGDLDEILLEVCQKVEIEDDLLEHESDQSDAVPTSKSYNLPTNRLHSSIPQMRVPSRVSTSSALNSRFEKVVEFESEDNKERKDKLLVDHSKHVPVTSSMAKALSHEPSVAEFVHLSPVDLELKMVDKSSIDDLNPHTISSNNAPSLVSDDGEYDEDNVDSGGSEDEVDHDDDIAEINIEEEIIAQAVLVNTTGRGSEGRRLRTEEKTNQVTIVNPITGTGKERLQTRHG
ncbi:Bgt-3521 [Blumeria graminis f. sp. tritici]|uniref:Bgt-3521 n=2 Tax=Blumeria graminis f. sp. tritici TaxID=62690 RepID=A0A9X9QFG6_BLUGR|nr:hypothetical protein BGT96224_3521 [Blumeria graminis f. sp. tritici 96224]VDB93159.1 Bgt-3521 [Blumeria graminis f. sp. tritici]